MRNAYSPTKQHAILGDDAQRAAALAGEGVGEGEVDDGIARV